MVKEVMRVIAFWLITWTIFNYTLIWEEIYLLTAGRPQKAFEFFINIYCLGWLPGFIESSWQIFCNFESSYKNGEILLIIIMFGYLVVMNGGAMWLWWRKQTIFNAFLLATAGTFASPVASVFFGASELNIACITSPPLFFLLLLVFLIHIEKSCCQNLIYQKPWRGADKIVVLGEVNDMANFRLLYFNRLWKFLAYQDILISIKLTAL